MLSVPGTAYFVVVTLVWWSPFTHWLNSQCDPSNGRRVGVVLFIYRKEAGLFGISRKWTGTPSRSLKREPERRSGEFRSNSNPEYSNGQLNWLSDCESAAGTGKMCGVRYQSITAHCRYVNRNYKIGVHAQAPGGTCTSAPYVVPLIAVRGCKILQKS